MNIWIRVYPAIENLQGISPETTTHNLSLGAVLCLSVYRTEGQAREAAKKYGGIVLETNADLLKSDTIQNDFYISNNEDDYIKGDPLLPTRIEGVTVLAASYKGDCHNPDEGAAFSEEDIKWIEALEEITNAHFNI